jgi:uncharacterized membrane-anchored protein
MRLTSLRRSRSAERLPGVTGVARLDRRTKDLTKRLRPGDIAIIDHVDIDRVSADALVSCRVAAVVNAAQSTSGRYPNLGPEILLAGGVPLVDDVGTDVFSAVREGDVVRLDQGLLYVEDRVVAKGVEQDAESITAAMAEARAGLHTQLEAFAANTMEYLLKERALLLDGVGVPAVRTDFTGRHALVVVRGYDYREDLATLRPYIREYRPVLIGVDGGADALLELGLKPDIIIGDFDSVSERALKIAPDLVHHVHPDGRAPGREQLVEWAVHYEEFVAEGTSEDVAMLLAWEAGASLIVAVGTHATMVEFLDKGRKGMASTFLTRLRIGPLLVDAKGVSRLYQGRVRNRDMLFLVGSAVLAMIAMVRASHSLQVFMDGFRLMLEHTWTRITDAF